MTKQVKIEADKIHILNIRTLRGNIDCPIDANIDNVYGHVFGFDLKTALQSQDNMVGLKLQVDIEAIDEANEKLPITGSYTHEIIFKIDNLDDFIEKENGGEWIDARLGSTLVTIIYSTVRGIIYSRTQGTSLGIVILPVIAPLKLMGFDELPNVQEEKEIISDANAKLVRKTKKAAKTNK
ncbi:MAG: hypothetical protein HYR66_15445 [Sphingobacteriales bacterium]|nr:hypothetical protein [Sphingobacteriales bacterium]MBI3717383.1 hypothetical protein [Sphingobacteriales bacterium]